MKSYKDIIQEKVKPTFEHSKQINLSEKYNYNGVDINNFADNLTRTILTGNGIQDTIKSLKKLTDSPANVESDTSAFNKDYSRAYKILQKALLQLYK